MASFAKLNSENIVIAVHSVVNEVLKDSNGIEQENIGIEFLKNLHGWQNWKQTSYNTNGGVHLLGGTPFRKNHAVIGFTYDSQRDAFIPPKYFNGWVLNEQTCLWQSPIPYPITYINNLKDQEEQKIQDRYTWNEETLNWILQTP